MPATPSENDLPPLLNAYEQALQTYTPINGVTGIDFGYCYDANQNRLDQFAVRVHRATGDEIQELQPGNFPATIDGVPLCIVDGKYAHQIDPLPNSQAGPPAIGPLRAGMGISLFNRAAGTLGLFVIEEETKARHILSCAHVIEPLTDKPKNILQPPDPHGTLDESTIAHFVRSINNEDGDAAIGLVATTREIGEEIHLTEVKIVRAEFVRLGDIVQKVGGATQSTCGVVDGIGTFFLDPASRLGMRGFRIVGDSHLGCGGDVSQGGDSGAVWFRKSDGVGLGLHTGGDLGVANVLKRPAIASHLPKVLELLKVRIQ